MRLAGWVGLALILLAALALRLHHLDWALPHTYEEAKPLRVAFQMWGWDRGADVNLNPEFFNYPSLVLYIHFIVQGLLFAVLRLGGGIESVIDWQVIYLTDPTVIYLVERTVTVAFALGSIAAAAAAARRVAGWPAALTAALLLAVNPFHIAHSQMIEVDMPLTFFAMLSLWAMVRITQSGERRHYLIASIAAGLAASSKYTGFFLAAPLVAAHLLAPRGRSLASLLRALGLMIAAFALTSPFVILDFGRFWRDLAMERSHMAEGHFGLAQASTWKFYAKTLAGGVVNPLVAVAALAGVTLGVVTRSRAMTVPLVFAALYLLTISTWTMRAERYLLPVIPVAAVFAGVAVAGLMRGTRRRRSALAAMAIVLACGIDISRHARAVSAIQSSAQTDATRWIEDNVPDGAFIVNEYQGPEFLAPVTLMQLDPGLREKVLAAMGTRPVYAVQMLPMTQTNPESSAPFYSLDLYPNADVVITSSGVRSRYERDPGRFARQLSFYTDVEATFERATEFAPAGGAGARITIYRRLPRVPPFSERTPVAPPALPVGVGRRAAVFYFELGANHEFFGHGHEAYVSYIRALDRGTDSRHVFMHSVLGVVRTLLATGQTGTAATFLSRVAPLAPDDDSRRLVGDLQRQIGAP